MAILFFSSLILPASKIASYWSLVFSNWPRAPSTAGTGYLGIGDAVYCGGSEDFLEMTDLGAAG